MTGKEVYSAALSLISQRDSEEPLWAEQAVGWLNIALYEVLPYDNALRVYGGQAPVFNVQRITSLEEKLPLHDRLFAAMAELLAAQLWTVQDEGYKAQDCRTRAEMELKDCVAVNPEPIRDVYWGRC